MPSQPDKPVTLCFDIGGTGVKSMLLDYKGRPVSERERVKTPQPATPDNVIEVMDEMVAKLKDYDRVSVGFPGVVKRAPL